MAFNEKLFYVSAVLDLNIRRDSIQKQRKSLSEDVESAPNSPSINLHNVL